MLSIIIPCKNEEVRLPSTLEKLGRWLKDKQDIEIIIVVEKSSDRTVDIAEAWAQHNPCRVIANPTAVGKGHAVRTGMLQAKGDNLLFMDADLAVTLDHIQPYLMTLQTSEADVVIANRNHPNSKIPTPQPLFRIISGKIFNLIIRMKGLTTSSDTQCGFKGFTKNAAQEIFKDLKSVGFGFDVEVLYLAKKKGYKIKEMPVEWHDQKGSKVGGLKDGVAALKEAITNSKV